MQAVRTLVVWCPDWPVVAAGEGNDTPAAVMAAGRVLACSAVARAAGVERGMRRRQAEALCPDLKVVPHDPGAEARAFEPVVAAVESLTPRVEVLRPGLCAAATRGPSRYFGGDDALVPVVEAAVDAALPPGARCRAGIADGVFAAEQASRIGVVVAAGESATFLAPLPVSTLPAAYGDVAARLRRLGIHTLGELAALPAPAMLARFGPEGAASHRLARGLDERPLAARTPPPDLAVVAELDPPAELVETAVFVARGMATRLCQTLLERGLCLTGARIELETEHGERLCRVWRHDGGLSDAALAERVRWQLDGWITSGHGSLGAITLLRLAPEHVGSDSGLQRGFWGGDRTAGERASRALVRVQGMLGLQAVVTAVAARGRSPAEQVQLVPWGDPPPPGGGGAAGAGIAVNKRGQPAPWPGQVPPPAPATVHRCPLPAGVTDSRGHPVRVSGRGHPSAEPAWLSVAGGGWVAVVAWAGPWPVDERWWDTGARRRRARWQMVTERGDAHLLAVEAGRWMVEATYD